MGGKEEAFDAYIGGGIVGGWGVGVGQMEYMLEERNGTEWNGIEQRTR